VSRQLVNRFMFANKAICQRVERGLPNARVDLRTGYEHVVAQYMNSCPGAVVADIGGGRSSAFASLRSPQSTARIVAVDVSATELELNADADEKRVADVTRNLPFGDGDVDLVTSSAVLEHLRPLEVFVAESSRVLKPGGYAIHYFSTKFALYAIANQLLPQPISKRIIHFIAPGTEGIVGFPAYYDRCYASAITRMHEAHGFELLELRASYYQSDYFHFLVPLYLVSALWDLASYAAGVKNLASYLLLVARKPVEAG
jgi:ubiquinone/menaquinone biosynthesis C-methylase UbiE